MAIFKTWRALAAPMVLLLASCGARDVASLYPVRGAAIYNKKPATGAMVAFHRLDKAGTNHPLPQAIIEADGSFQVSTYTRHDGAPMGRYAVTVHWPSEAVRDEDGTPAGPDRLRRRYGDPQKTPLQVEVRAESNELQPFVLK